MVLESTPAPTPLTMRQMMFLEGAKDLVLNQHPFPNKAQTLLIILFTGIIDGDLERVRWAMDNGADANMAIQQWAIDIIRRIGWSGSLLGYERMISFTTARSTDAPQESEQTLPQCDETGPDSEASQEAI